MDRITRVRIKNVRAIEYVDLELSRPLTVLIGENGSGKSTIIECLELLRKAADPSFMQQFYNMHRGMPGLLRRGAPLLELGVRVEDDAGRQPAVDYSFSLSVLGTGAAVSAERMLVGPTPKLNASVPPDPAVEALQKELAERQAKAGPVARGNQVGSPRGTAARAGAAKTREIAELRERIRALEDARKRRETEPLEVIRRDSGGAEVFDQSAGRYARVAGQAATPDRLVISGFGTPPPNDAIERLLRVLRGIEAHLGFDTVASWAARSYQRPETVRWATTHFPADRLSLLAANLANAWSELLRRKEADRERTMALVRLGLGERVDAVVVEPDRGGGNVHLALRFLDLSEPLYAGNLSDGQLAWLAFVAMTRLNEGRSMLVVDEPELHLHPSLLGRVVSMLSSLEGGAPVLLCTHADRVLELVDNPADAVRVCSLEGNKAVLSRIDASELPRWLEQFGDLGQLRASGYLSRVLVPTASEPLGSVDGDS